MSDKALDLTPATLELTQRIQLHFPRDLDPALVSQWNGASGDAIERALKSVFASSPPRHAAVHTSSAPAPDFNPIIRVDRSVKPSYPDWVTKVLYPELELSGPAEFDINSLEQYLHEKQKPGSYIGGHDLHKFFKKKDMLKDSLGLADLLAIQARGIDFFRKYFAGKAVFAWKSVVQDSDGDLRVPCLYGHGDEVVLGWHWLDRVWDADYPALRSAK